MVKNTTHYRKKNKIITLTFKYCSIKPNGLDGFFFSLKETSNILISNTSKDSRFGFPLSSLPVMPRKILCERLLAFPGLPRRTKTSLKDDFAKDCFRRNDGKKKLRLTPQTNSALFKFCFV